MRLITPKRLKENEAFMWRLADRTIDEFVARGECEFISDFTLPYSILVIAELLGVPEADRAKFRHRLDTQVPGVVDSADGGMMDAARVPLRASSPGTSRTAARNRATT